MVLQVWPYKIFLIFVFFFKFGTNWWMNLHFYIILYIKKPIAHDVLPVKTQVETHNLKFKVTLEQMVNGSKTQVKFSYKCHLGRE